MWLFQLSLLAYRHMLVELGEFACSSKEQIEKTATTLLNIEKCYVRAEKKCWTDLDTFEDRIVSLKLEVQTAAEKVFVASLIFTEPLQKQLFHYIHVHALTV